MFSISEISVDRPTLVAPGGQVIHPSANFNPQWSRHGSKPHSRSLNCQFVRCDPCSPIHGYRQSRCRGDFKSRKAFGQATGRATFLRNRALMGEKALFPPIRYRALLLSVVEGGSGFAQEALVAQDQQADQCIRVAHILALPIRQGFLGPSSGPLVFKEEDRS